MSTYQPLTPAVFHVLLALADGEKHGYAIMKSVEDHTGGTLKMGAGTLYGTLRRLTDAGWVLEAAAPQAQSVRDERRRFYRLTGDGREALGGEVRRLEDLVRVARRSRGVPRPARRSPRTTEGVVVHAYAVLLRLYPEAFRRRYAAEMSLDFADALDAARAGGWLAVGVFAVRVRGDLAVSLLREWTRNGRLALTAATAGVTLLLWALALRPWAWRWDIRPGPPPHAPATPVTEVELLVLVVLALLPVVVVILFAGYLTRIPSPRARRRERP